MPRNPLKYLYDIRQAAERAQAFTSGRSFADYQRDAMLRAAVERQFEIIGEAANCLARLDPELAGRLRGTPQIIAFRNRLIHGYDQVSDQLVWDALRTHLPTLLEEVRQFMKEMDTP